MSLSKYSPVRVRKADQAAQILEARRKGLSFRAIAEKFSLSQRRVRDIVKEQFEGLLDANNKVAGKALEKNLKRLDELLEAVWDEAMQGDVKAVGAACQVIDRQNRLLGLDAPKKGEATIQFAGILAAADLSARAAELGLTLEQLRGPAPAVAHLPPMSSQIGIAGTGERPYTETTPQPDQQE